MPSQIKITLSKTAFRDERNNLKKKGFSRKRELKTKPPCCLVTSWPQRFIIMSDDLIDWGSFLASFKVESAKRSYHETLKPSSRKGFTAVWSNQDHTHCLYLKKFWLCVTVTLWVSLPIRCQQKSQEVYLNISLQLLLQTGSVAGMFNFVSTIELTHRHF